MSVDVLSLPQKSLASPHEKRDKDSLLGGDLNAKSAKGAKKTIV
jgi:hypothetical protein